MGRILIILIAALAVVGFTVALIDRGILSTNGPEGLAGGRPDISQFEDRQRPESDLGGHSENGAGHPGRGANSFLPGLLKNLGVIAAIVALVIATQWLWRRMTTIRAKPPGDNGKTTLTEKPPEPEIL